MADTGLAGAGEAPSEGGGSQLGQVDEDHLRPVETSGLDPPLSLPTVEGDVSDVERPDAGAEGTMATPPDHAVSIHPEPPELYSGPSDEPAPAQHNDDRHDPDSPTASLIAALRAQVDLLTDQAHALNTKLVSSISLHADLEDQHFALQHQHGSLRDKAGELEKEKARWEESMNTGFLVERSQITAEMQRLASGLVEEERRRGSAEQRRQLVENEVDDLAASLFGQANTMVAAERMSRVQAEARLKSTEDNLAAAEAAMRDMQLHLQSLPASAASHSSPPTGPGGSSISRRYLASHLPYTEYLAFLSHLRSLRPLKDTSKAIFPPPLLINLLVQAFLNRTVAEDHDATLRLDVAPDLGWMSRKGVSQAVMAGDLVVEPVPGEAVVSSTSGVAHEIACSLCGKPVFPATVPQSPAGVSHFGPPPLHPTQRTTSSSRFSLKPFFNSSSPGPSASPTQSPLSSPALTSTFHSTGLGIVYVFRVAKASANESVAEAQLRLYPLCKTGWCLERLRATCELWHFIRTGIVHPVWHGDDGYTFSSEPEPVVTKSRPSSANSGMTASPSQLAVAPAERPVPPKKKSWGLGFGKGWGNKGGSVATASPPASPRLLPPPLDGAGPLGLDREAAVAVKEFPTGQPNSTTPPSVIAEPDVVSAIGGGLGAPLELDSEKDSLDSAENAEKYDSPPDEEEDEQLSKLIAAASEVNAIDTSVPRIQQIAASPAQPISATVPTGSHAEAGLSDRPPLERQNSNSSTSNTDEGFGTPRGGVAELPMEDNQAGGSNGSAGGNEAVNLSPRPPRSRERSPGGPRAPPIPRRNQARTRPSSTASDLNPEPPSTEHREDNDADAPTAAASRDDSRPSGEAVRPPHHPETSPRAPPPLPVRHPKTPIAQVQDVQGEKRYLPSAEDGWEVRTWKTVVRLKEEMWRARIGVMDV